MERMTKTVNGVVTYIGPGCEYDTGLVAGEMTGTMIRQVLRRLAYYEELDEKGLLPVLPCKPGDDLWWIDDEKPFVKCEKESVKAILITKEGIRIGDHHYEQFKEVGSRYCLLSSEDAREWLEKHRKENKAWNE